MGRRFLQLYVLYFPTRISQSSPLLLIHIYCTIRSVKPRIEKALKASVTAMLRISRAATFKYTALPASMVTAIRGRENNERLYQTPAEDILTAVAARRWAYANPTWRRTELWPVQRGTGRLRPQVGSARRVQRELSQTIPKKEDDRTAHARCYTYIHRRFVTLGLPFRNIVTESVSSILERAAKKREGRWDEDWRGTKIVTNDKVSGSLGTVHEASLANLLVSHPNELGTKTVELRGAARTVWVTLSTRQMTR